MYSVHAVYVHDLHTTHHGDTQMTEKELTKADKSNEMNLYSYCKCVIFSFIAIVFNSFFSSFQRWVYLRNLSWNFPLLADCVYSTDRTVINLNFNPKCTWAHDKCSLEQMTLTCFLFPVVQVSFHTDGISIHSIECEHMRRRSPNGSWQTLHFSVSVGNQLWKLLSKSYGNGIGAKGKQKQNHLIIIERWFELHEQTFVSTLLFDCISGWKLCLKFSLTLNGREWHSLNGSVAAVT